MDNLIQQFISRMHFFLNFLVYLLEIVYNGENCHRSGVSDSGISMICNVFPDTLTRLLLALCPNVTSSIFLLLIQLPHKTFMLA